MTRQLRFILLFSGSVFCGSFAGAQQLDTSDLKDNVEILSGVLREGLGVNETPGLFGLNESRVDSVYVRGQGVVMDIQTPLARRRNRLNINALATSISRFPRRSNPFEAVQQTNTSGANNTIAFSSQPGTSETMYRILLEEIQSIDVTSLIDNSIRQASSSARSLRELGELDQDSFNSLQQELYSMREDLGEMRESLMQQIDELRQMDSELIEDSTTSSPAESDMRLSLESLKQAVEQLKTNAESRATNLSEQYESAKAEYEVQWRVEIANLETRLYALLCDYGATLRDLPGDEYLTIVFSDLGDESEADARTDKIHMLAKADMEQCQSGRIDASTLQQRSSSYSY
jgi:hypothetical protein